MENLIQKSEVLKQDISEIIFNNYMMGFRKTTIDIDIKKEHMFMEAFNNNCNKNIILQKLSTIDLLAVMNISDLREFSIDKMHLLNQIGKMAQFDPNDKLSILGDLSENITREVSVKIYKEDDRKEKSREFRNKLNRNFENSGLNASYEAKRRSSTFLDEKERELQGNIKEETSSNASLFK